MRHWKVENGGNTTIESQRLLYLWRSWILTVPSQSHDLANCWPWIVTCNNVLSPPCHHCSSLSSTMSTFDNILMFSQFPPNDSPKSIVVKSLKTANDFICDVGDMILDDKESLQEEQKMWIKEWNVALVHCWSSWILYDAEMSNRINSIAASRRLASME